jgi:hypothetical protein
VGGVERSDSFAWWCRALNQRFPERVDTDTGAGQRTEPGDGYSAALNRAGGGDGDVHYSLA